MLKKLGIIIVSLFIFICCTGNEENNTMDDILNAPQEIEINGEKYILETYLWRDFMPISPPDGKPLQAIIIIENIDSNTFLSTIDVNYMWVINESYVWETELETQEADKPNQLKKRADEGPKWEPGTLVEVVVRIIDETTGQEYLLKAAEQTIEQTN